MRYREPSRFRRVAKWGGLTLSVLLVSAWVASEVVSVKCGMGRVAVGLSRGGTATWIRPPARAEWGVEAGVRPAVRGCCRATSEAWWAYRSSCRSGCCSFPPGASPFGYGVVTVAHRRGTAKPADTTSPATRRAFAPSVANPRPRADHTTTKKNVLAGCVASVRVYNGFSRY